MRSEVKRQNNRVDDRYRICLFNINPFFPYRLEKSLCSMILPMCIDEASDFTLFEQALF